MGRRKRRKKIVRRRRTLPTIYQCPHCGATTVGVSINKKEATVIVKCASCGLSHEFEYKEYLHPVDYYARFLDKYDELMISGQA